ncbi:GvpL/GvpF family gas vesicle protein [Actinorugispora endophytica]|uniref:Gas vesicle protein GvpL/GvpF n=1 Tax=Actinorugispora endophytica TaxID=1605990 RepID=A0A4R6V503_9ACTN|nr:GvpL/GvpF family gas vesicle protein [Actinorugispora endophytica]TDQ55384.1 gas vesicle protein GvpL/GvpF [Actinorugispora endophytica]
MSTCVYGIVADSHPLGLDGLRGIGAPGSEVRVVGEAGLAAVVSTAPERVRAKRRDVLAHQALLDRLGGQGTVLPMRFGTVAPSDEAVAGELRAGAGHYRSLLEELRGRVELNVRAAHSEEAVLREVLREDEGLRETCAELRAAGAGIGDRLAFGESVARAVEARCRRDADRVTGALRGHAERVSLGPLVNGCSLNLSILVDRDRVGAVEREVDRLREALDGLADIRLHGPLSPYSFVAAGRPAAAG